MLGFSPLASAPLADDGLTVVAIAASNVQASASTLSSPVLTQVHSLLANDVDASNPTLDASSITQVHNISLDDITVAGTVDSVNLLQNHFVGPSLVGSNPTIGTPVITQEHNLAPSDVDASNPTLDTPVITQLHVLAADDVTSAGTVGSPNLVQNHFVGASLTGSSPTIGVPTLTQEHIFTTTSVATSDPTLDAVDLTVLASFSANNITTPNPFTANPFSVVSYALTADGLFDSTQQYYTNIFTNNRGFNSNLIPTTGHLCTSPTTVSNLSVSSVGISFRLSGQKIIQYANGNWSIDGIYYTDIFLSWTDSTLTATTATFASSLPSGSSPSYLLGSSALDSAIVAAATAAGVSSQIYDWIPSEVTVTNSGISSNIFRSRLAGSTTDRDTFTFNYSTFNGLLNSFYTFGRRFLLKTEAPNQNVSTSPSTSIHFVRFDRALQYEQVRYTVLTEQPGFAPVDLLAGAPTLDTPVITQAGGTQQPLDITATAPDIDSVGLSEAQSLTTNSIATAAPTLDAAVLTQDHILGTQDVATTNSTVSSPSVGIVHVLSANDITSTPTVDSVAITQVHNLTLTDVSSSSITIGQAVLTQVHVLSAANINAAPTVDSASLSQLHDFTVTDINTDAPTLGLPVLATSGLHAPLQLRSGAITIDSPSITQIHDISTVPVAASATVDTVDLTQIHLLTAADIVASSTVGSPAVADNKDLAANSISTGAATVGTPVATVSVFSHSLSPSNIVTRAARVQYNLSRRRIVNIHHNTGRAIDEGGFADLGVTGTFSNSVEVTGIAA